jgi:hypothetical protein
LRILLGTQAEGEGYDRAIRINQQTFDSSIEHISFAFEHIENMDELKQLRLFPALTSASFSGTNLDDVGLEHVSQVSSLENLNLQNTRISKLPLHLQAGGACTADRGVGAAGVAAERSGRWFGKGGLPSPAISTTLAKAERIALCYWYYFVTLTMDPVFALMPLEEPEVHHHAELRREHIRCWTRYHRAAIFRLPSAGRIRQGYGPLGLTMTFPAAPSIVPLPAHP